MIDQKFTKDKSRFNKQPVQESDGVYTGCLLVNSLRYLLSQKIVTIHYFTLYLIIVYHLRLINLDDDDFYD